MFTGWHCNIATFLTTQGHIGNIAFLAGNHSKEGSVRIPQILLGEAHGKASDFCKFQIRLVEHYFRSNARHKKNHYLLASHHHHSSTSKNLTQKKHCNFWYFAEYTSASAELFLTLQLLDFYQEGRIVDWTQPLKLAGQPSSVSLSVNSEDNMRMTTGITA